MSGSGGFYKYRCKNFYSHNCPNWVWVNNSPCAICIAEGKDETSDDSSSSWSWSGDVIEPPGMRIAIAIAHQGFQIAAAGGGPDEPGPVRHPLPVAGMSSRPQDPLLQGARRERGPRAPWQG